MVKQIHYFDPQKCSFYPTIVAKAAKLGARKLRIWNFLTRSGLNFLKVQPEGVSFKTKCHHQRPKRQLTSTRVDVTKVNYKIHDFERYALCYVQLNVNGNLYEYLL